MPAKKPMKNAAEFAFDSVVTSYKHDKFCYSVIHLPPETVASLPGAGRTRLRAAATINGIDTKCAIMPGGDATMYIFASKDLQKRIGAGHGQAVRVRFTLEPTDAVAMPEELAAALQKDAEARSLWDALTPGKRRGFAFRVSSAKTSATRAKRVEEVLDSLRPLRFPGT